MILIGILILAHLACAQQFESQPIRINQRKTFTFASCSKLIFSTGYKRLKINLLNASNVKSILFSDTEIQSDCFLEDKFYHQCVDSGSFCTYFKNPKNNIYHEVGFCAQKVFVYIQNDQTVDSTFQTFQPVTIMVHSEYINSPCTSIVEDNYVKCGGSDSTTCENTCLLSCVYVKCHQKLYQKQKFGLCLPVNLTKQEYLDRCKMEFNINQINVTSACTQPISKVIAQSKENPLVSILVIIFIIFLLSIVYYRYEIKKTGRAPFNPPSICPMFIYPNPPARSSQNLRE